MGEAAAGGAERDAAEQEKHISRLRAALKASERQRERQAALHKQELEALQSRIEQVTLAPYHSDNLCDRHTMTHQQACLSHQPLPSCFVVKDLYPLPLRAR